MHKAVVCFVKCSVQCTKNNVMCAAALCAVSMLRVDWQGEAKKARLESLAIQAAHEDANRPCQDFEQALITESTTDSSDAQLQHSNPGQLHSGSYLAHLRLIPGSSLAHP